MCGSGPLRDAMGISQLIRQWVEPGPSATVVHECRHCGTTLTGQEESCPACDSSAISRYEIR
jgi:rubrerythrin